MNLSFCTSFLVGAVACLAGGLTTRFWKSLTSRIIITPLIGIGVPIVVPPDVPPRRNASVSA